MSDTLTTLESMLEIQDKLPETTEAARAGREILVAAIQEIKDLRKLASLVTVGQVIEAGDDYINAAGLNPWCLNEGLANADDKLEFY